MTLKLRVRTQAWRRHVERLAADVTDIVPVAKGTGYGFGNTTLADECTRMGLNTIAVGVAQEAVELLEHGFAGDVLVLNPWRPGDAVATSLLSHERVISVLSRAEDVQQVAELQPDARVHIEVLTSMKRHGIAPGELSEIDFGNLNCEAWSIHLPSRGRLEEALALAEAALAVRRAEVWVSHLSLPDFRKFQRAFDEVARMRVGTRLWLGAPETLKQLATVVDVHPVTRGDHVGYHQHRVPGPGHVVVIGAGTSHGVALSPPTSAQNMRQRVVRLAEGALDAVGRSLSPFVVAGKKRPFVEPPHMHASMVFVPGSTPPVSVGDEVPVTVSAITARFDEIEWA